MAHVRVLIADDSPSFRREIRTLLELEQGIEVVGEATDGWEAIEQTDALQPDVVLMDNNMPSLAGLDATLRIRARHPDIRILFLVAEDIWREEALAAGAEGYFLKSADLDRLFHEIRKTPRLAYQERARDRIEGTRKRWRAAFGDRAILLGPAGRALAFCFSVWIVGAAVVQMARRLDLATPQTDSWLIFSAVALGPLLGVASFLLSLRDAVSVGRKRLEQRESRLPAPLRRLQEHPNYDRLAKIAWL
ncbi:MAG: response regulator transcription factor, partial [Anaerolineae bacterium]